MFRSSPCAKYPGVLRQLRSDAKASAAAERNSAQVKMTIAARS
jgi:hypothetical protein